jgi:hypothetical protein
MTTMPLEWHKKNLKNATNYYQRMKETIDAEFEKYTSGLNELTTLTKQISEAERLGKTKFDADKFMMKRKEKNK